MSIQRLSAASYILKTEWQYADVYDLHPLYEKLAFHSNMIVSGPKGIGKSLSIASYAGKRGYPTITFDCSEDIRRSHLIGTFVLRGQETPFVLGPLTTAIEVANEAGACVLILEEINACTPSTQKILNALTDWRRAIEVPEAEHIFRLKPEAKLWVTGTMNAAVYGGVHAVNEDLKSRFRMLALDYPEAAQERTIVDLLLPGIDKKLIDRVLTLAVETRQAAWDYALSTRDVVQILEDAQRVGIELALHLVLGKFEQEERATLSHRVQSIFALKTRKAS